MKKEKKILAHQCEERCRESRRRQGRVSGRFFFFYFIEQCQFRWSILEVCLLYTEKKKSEGEKDMMHWFSKRSRLHAVFHFPKEHPSLLLPPAGSAHTHRHIHTCAYTHTHTIKPGCLVGGRVCWDSERWRGIVMERGKRDWWGDSEGEGCNKREGLIRLGEKERKTELRGCREKKDRERRGEEVVRR